MRAYLGAAVHLTASLEFSGANYQTAWALICDRFNNNRMLIQNHDKTLFNFDKIRVESSASLRGLNDGVSKHLRALKTLNEPTDSWETLIIYLITIKLDDVSLRKWEQVTASHSLPTLGQMFQFLKERADLLESLEQCAGNSKQLSLIDFTNFNRNKGSKSVFAGSNDSIKCVICFKDHYITDCAQFLNLDVNGRFEAAKKNRLCLNV